MKDIKNQEIIESPYVSSIKQGLKKLQSRYEILENLDEVITENENERKIKKTISTYRYLKSTRTKILLNPHLKDVFKFLMDEVLKHSDVKYAIGFKNIRIYSGRNTLARINAIGKRIYLYLALDPNSLDEKYKVIDVSEKRIGEKTPTLFRVYKTRSVQQARALLHLVLKENGKKRNDDEVLSFDYKTFFKDDNLERLFELSDIKEYRVKRKLTVIEHEDGTIMEEAIEEETIEDFEDDEEEIIEEQEEIEDEDDEIFVLEEESTYEEPVIEPIVEEVKPEPRKVKEQKKQIVKKEKVKKVSKPKEYIEILNLDTISHLFDDGATITLSILKEKGIFSKKVTGYKVLARGYLRKKFNIEANDFSKEAILEIKQNGGSYKLV